MRLHWPDLTLPPINLWTLPTTMHDRKIMTTDTSPAEADEAWLYKIMPDATDDEVDAFIDRVAHLILRAGYSQTGARNYAFEGLLMKRAGIKHEN
jgi:hypothetical protein